MGCMRTVGPSSAAPASARRRRLLGALGAGVLGASLGGCATAPVLPPRPVDRALAPRVGDTWTYQYSSVFRAVAPRTLEVRVLEVGQAALRDRLTIVGAAGDEERLLTSALELVERPLAGLTFYDFSPYLQAFGALPAEGAVATPTPNWGQPFTGRARLSALAFRPVASTRSAWTSRSRALRVPRCSPGSIRRSRSRRSGTPPRRNARFNGRS